MAPERAAPRAAERAPEQLPLPAGGVVYLLELALRTQLGEAWWHGFTAAHGAPSWVAEKRYAFRVADGAPVAVVRRGAPAGEE